MYAFEYQRAKSVADAAAALAKTGGKALAGGQSLVGAMKLRLANPGTVIDIGGIAELKGIKQDGAAVVIGAMSTHADVASSAVVKKAIPALAGLAEGIGDRQVRNRGTIGGSLANNDPAADYPAAVLALGATVRDRAWRRRDHHRYQLSGSKKSRVREVSQSRLALCAGRCLRRSNTKWRACSGHRRCGARASRHRDRECTGKELHGRRGESGQDSGRSPEH